MFLVKCVLHRSRYFSIVIANKTESLHYCTTVSDKLDVIVPARTPQVACQHVHVSAGKVTIGVLVRTETEREGKRERECKRETASDLLLTAGILVADCAATQ